jgi:predicted exporter
LRFALVAVVIIIIGVTLFIRYPLQGDIAKALPSDQASGVLEEYSAFDSSRKLLVLVEGFDGESLDRAYEIKERLSHLDQVQSVYFDPSDIDPKAKEYLANNWFYLSDFNTTIPERTGLKSKLQELKNEMLQGGVYSPLDTNDPLGLFTQPAFIQGAHKEGMMIVPNRGYCVMAQVKPSVGDMENSQQLYDEAWSVLKPYGTKITVFCPNFYSVENSRFIQNDVEKITALTIAMLIGVYFFLLRNKVLLFFSLTTLFLSGLLAILIVKMIFADVSMLVVAFGAGIATIAEDYLFMLFLNDSYKKREFNWAVFWGFCATQVGLLSLSLINFPLIAQLALFAFISLTISYLIFVFIFPRLQFYAHQTTKTRERLVDFFTKFSRIPPIVFTLLSVVLITLSVSNLTFDPNFRHLDYQNRPLLEAEKLFSQTLGEDKTPVIIRGKTQEELLINAQAFRHIAPKSYSIANMTLSNKGAQERKAHIEAVDFVSLRHNLEGVAKEVGFREGMFSQSYRSLSTMNNYSLDKEAIKSLGLEIIETSQGYSSLAYVSADELTSLKGLPYVSIVDAKELLSHSALNALSEFRAIFLLGFVAMLLIVVSVTRRKALYALNFLFFPVAVIIALFAWNGSYNLMHLFTLFLMMVYGIDYGIYLSRGEMSASMRAVVYSCLTTFAGFGVLILSEVPAVHSIGETSIVGILAILILFFQKRVSV